jgi:nicotinate-nucleotide adenylyltransferase
MTERKLRIGLFGGSFDPVHNAHVALARTALDRLELDQLRWLPAGQPWQKTDHTLAPAEHRVAMLKLALGDELRYMLDQRELYRTGPSYTIDTLHELQDGTDAAEWFLIIGQDQYSRLHTWHQWEELLGEVTLAVAGRAGETPRASSEVAAVPHRCVPLPLPAMDVSATRVRDELAQGRSIEGLVPAAVARYIAQHHLYRGTHLN